jgi:hypothetical protein
MAGRLGLPALLVTLVLGASAGQASAACAGRQSVADAVSGKAWFVTVYYTAVESFHADAPVVVLGCLSFDCVDKDQPLGQYPGGFVTAVKDEGAGRITSGRYAGKYLNWSHDIGYWLDLAPRDAHGRPLEPFRSAAADDLADGTRLRLVDCGRLDSGDPPPAEVCETLRNGDWEIRDRFTPGLGGPQHIDLYIGEETMPDFPNTSPLYVALHDATFALGD